MAKQTLATASYLRLPAGVVVARDVADDGTPILERRLVFEEIVVQPTPMSGKPAIDGVTPDVIVAVDGVRLLVEIVVFHRLSESKSTRLAALGMPCLLIDLGLFKQTHADVDLLTRELLDNPHNRFWVMHPAFASVKEELQEALHQEKERRRQEYLEAVKRHQENEARWEAQRQVLLSRPRPRVIPNVEMPRPAVALVDAIRWRAAFPTTQMMRQAQVALAAEIGVELGIIQSVMASVERRSDLAKTTPKNIVSEWAAEFGCSEDVIVRFLLMAHLAIN